MEAMVILLTSDVQIADLRRRRILSIVRSVGDGCRMEINMAKKQKTKRLPVNFAKCNILVGAELVYVEDSNVICLIV